MLVKHALHVVAAQHFPKTCLKRLQRRLMQRAVKAGIAVTEHHDVEVLRECRPAQQRGVEPTVYCILIKQTKAGQQWRCLISADAGQHPDVRGWLIGHCAATRDAVTPTTTNSPGYGSQVARTCAQPWRICQDEPGPHEHKHRISTHGGGRKPERDLGLRLHSSRTAGAPTAHLAVVSQHRLVTTPPTITVSTPHRCSCDPRLVFWKASYVFFSVMYVSSGCCPRPSTSCHASLPRLRIDRMTHVGAEHMLSWHLPCGAEQ